MLFAEIGIITGSGVISVKEINIRKPSVISKEKKIIFLIKNPSLFNRHKELYADYIFYFCNRNINVIIGSTILFRS